MSPFPVSWNTPVFCAVSRWAFNALFPILTLLLRVYGVRAVLSDRFSYSAMEEHDPNSASQSKIVLTPTSRSSQPAPSRRPQLRQEPKATRGAPTQLRTDPDAVRRPPHPRGSLTSKPPHAALPPPFETWSARNPHRLLRKRNLVSPPSHPPWRRPAAPLPGRPGWRRAAVWFPQQRRPPAPGPAERHGGSAAGWGRASGRASNRLAATPAPAPAPGGRTSPRRSRPCWRSAWRRALWARYGAGPRGAPASDSAAKREDLPLRGLWGAGPAARRAVMPRSRRRSKRANQYLREWPQSSPLWFGFFFFSLCWCSQSNACVLLVVWKKLTLSLRVIG